MGEKKMYSRFSVLLGSLALSIWLALRMVLWLRVDPTSLGVWQSAQVFGLGTWFDLATVTWLVAPVLLGTALLPSRWQTGRVANAARWGLLWVAAVGLLFSATAEFTFWQEFDTRFNFIAVDYLLYTNEIIGNVQESYPMGWILGGIGLAALGIVVGLQRLVRFPSQGPSRSLRLACLGLAVALPAGSLALADIDQMEATGNAFADELTGNGAFTLAAAMRRNELDYDRFYATIPQAKADEVLARLGMERRPLSPLEAAAAEVPAEADATMSPFTRRPKNVVLISVESLSAEFLGVYGNNKGLTPNLDRLAAEGLRFDRLFATGTRTVRGLEALSLGTPPVPGQAIVRRPGNEHLATIGEALVHQGWATYFIYGGYGYFDNMNAWFHGNDYQVIDRTDFPGKTIPFENVWGVADEALFSNALDALDRSEAGKPFFAHIMTTSNHRPFTYPDGRIDIPSPGGRKGAVKYTDYAIGRFIEEAKSRPWFDDTLFVIVADHCASVAGKTKLPVEKYRIPMIFYAPALLPPSTYTRMASQIDLAPTLLDVVGAEGAEEFFGESLFRADPGPERAFVSNYQELGYYKDGTLTVLLPRQRVQSYRIDPETFAATEAEVDPALQEEAIAWYQTASRSFRRGALRSQAHQQPLPRAASR